MKKTLYLLFLLISLSGCLSTKVDFNTPSSMVNIIQQEILTKTTIAEENTSVSMKDVEAFLHYKNLGYGKTAVSVEPLSDGEDTLLYVINYNKGWDIIAGDKRAPVIIATGDNGGFSKEIENVEMLAWVESLAADVKILMHLKDYSSLTNEQLTNIEQSKHFWRLICCDEELISSTLREERFSIFDTLPVYPGTGHWELVNVSSSSVVYDDIRLTETQWGQEGNYNEYCPLISAGSQYHVYAGCVAVAGAQMLLYLHDKLGTPVFAPDTAYCNIPYGSGYGYTGGASSSTWNYMKYNSINLKNCYSAAVLIADVGKRVGMDYSPSGSEASTSDLVDDVFEYYGISCSYSSYDLATVKESLTNGMPVIARADGTVEYILGLFPVYSDGHCFIIDGYKRNSIQYINEYEWVWDEWWGPGPAMPYIRPKTTVTYDIPYVTHFRMNWGWGGLHNDDYFAPSGDWLIQDVSTTYNFIYQRAIIHNFSISD